MQCPEDGIAEQVGILLYSRDEKFDKRLKSIVQKRGEL